jgi:WD40 repeat protein
MVPGAHPLDELEIALTRIAASQPFHLHEQLRRDQRGLVRAASLILPDDGTELVLVIDQFEETFTLVDQEEERAHFLALLYAAVTEPHSRLRVVITLRADFFDRPLHYPRFGTLVHSRLETLMPLSTEELERAIVRPAERVGVTFEPGLVATIIGDVNYQPGALPLLQFALTELFEARQGRTLTREGFNAIGGTLGALVKRAEKVYQTLSEPERALTRQIFLRLVTLGEGVEDTRRRVSRSELKTLTPDIDMLDDVLEAFESYRLLSFDADPGTRSPTVEIAHEALLREWERLRLWLAESRDDIRTQRQLAHMASEWQGAAKDPSFLAQGSRLTAFAAWAQTTPIVLTTPERAFLEASIQRRTSDHLAETQRQAREKTLERRTQTVLRGLVAVLLIAVLISGGFAIFALDREAQAQIARIDALDARATSEANFTRSEQQRLHLAADQAMDDFAAGNVGVALAVRSLNYGYTPEADAALMRATRQGIVLQTLTGHQFEVGAVRFSPDGTRAALGGEGGTRIYDVVSGEELLFLSQEGWVSSARFSSDGAELLTIVDNRVQVWNTHDGSLLDTYRLGAEAISADFFATETQIIARTSRDYQVWDRVTGDRLETYPLKRPGQPDLAALIARGHDHLLFAYSDSDNRVTVEDPLTPDDHCALLEAGTVSLRRLWASDSQPVAVLLTDDNRAHVWNLDTCTLLAQFAGHSDPINVIDYDPNRAVVVTGDESGLAIQWDSHSGREIARYHTTSWVRTLDISPDGTKLLMPNWNTASVWDLTYSQEPRQILTDQFNGTHFPHFSPDGNYLYIGGYGIYSRWALDGDQAQHLLTYEQPIRVMDLSSDGRYVYGPLEFGDHATYLIDAETGATVRRFTGHTQAVNWVDISSDGAKVVGSSFDLTARIWDAATGDLLHVLRGHTGVVASAMFSPDGSRVVTTSSDGTLRLWDTITGEETRSVFIDAPLPFADFSPDGKTLVAADTNGFGHLVDVETGTVRHTLSGHTNTVWTAKFSPDGLLVATASWDGTARIWDARTGALLRTLRDGRSTAVYWAEFSPDGRTIVTGGDLDDRVYLWRVNLDDVIAAYCSRSPLELTPEQRAQYGIPDDDAVCSTGTINLQ